MSDIASGIHSVLEACEVVHPGETVLIIADNDGRSMWLGQKTMEIVDSLGAEPSMIIINPPEMRGAEPPVTAAAAMKCVNTCIRITTGASLVHTTARKEATAAGMRYCTIGNIPLEDIRRGAAAEDIRLIRERTGALAEKLTLAKEAAIRTPAGTDIILSIADRSGISLHPLSPLVSGMPYYAEAAVAPVEGSVQGTIVVDVAFIDWDYVLLEPVRLEVKDGLVAGLSGPEKEIGRLEAVFSSYENARNIGELGIGTSHIIPLPVLGTRRDAARMGTAHFALGRNNDIGGRTWSEIHWDMVCNNATVELDGVPVLKDGKLLI